MKGKKIECTKCGEEFTMSTANFFKSYSPLHESNGLVPICKNCVKTIFNEFIDNGKTPKEAIIELCKMLDKPFIDEEYTNVINNKKGQDLDCDDVGIFLKHVHMMQWRRRGICRYEHSIFEKKNEEIIQNNKIIYNNNENVINDTELTITELENKWGFGYKEEELILFEKKYNFLKNNYTGQTNMHIEALQNYVRYRVKEELATAKGNVKDAKDWGALADKAATNAKINPSQLSKSDLTGGLNGFGELTRAVEQAIDIIAILPKFKEKPQDKVDFTLWCYVNYARDLKGLPPCSYKDIYGFYDQRKKEYEKHTSKEDNIFEQSFEEDNSSSIEGEE
jgi:hypothetical protein